MSESSYDRIKSLCDENGIAVTALETRLGYGRGYIGKMRHTKKIPSDRAERSGHADYATMKRYTHALGNHRQTVTQKINKNFQTLFQTGS